MTSRAKAAVILLAIASITIQSQALARHKPTANRDSQRAVLVAKIRKTAKEYPGLNSDPYFIATIRAIGQVHREDFVPEAMKASAYQETALPIGFDQTISDPYVVTIMTAMSRISGGANVLEIGTGSGYQAAILSQLGATVHSIEIVPELAATAAERLNRLHFDRVTVKSGDGFAGWPEFGPYDAIIITAGAAAVPPALIAQLKTGGRLIMPVGPSWANEQLDVFTKRVDESLQKCSLGPVMFVPLTGRGQRPPKAMGLYDRSTPDCFALRMRK
jgi:protein-L-isoaspartate(D-aspartate) O-methyltransferase